MKRFSPTNPPATPTRSPLVRKWPEIAQQPDLLDDPVACEEWGNAFNAWLDAMRARGTLRTDASANAYKQLWSTLQVWATRAQSPAIPVDRLTAQDLNLYISTRAGRAQEGAEVTARHAWRLLTLVDRVLVHRAQLRGDVGAANRCARALLEHQPKWRFAHTEEHEPALQHLSGHDARQLVDFLRGCTPRAGRRGALRSWREVRDATAVALHLGGGLTPREVRALAWSDVRPGQDRHQATRLVVQAHGQTPRREVPIAAWAARLLAHWMDVRAELQTVDAWLLPATSTGKPWGKTAHNDAVTRVLELAQLPEASQPGGCFRLRHTFALRQLARGTTLDDLGRLLGLRDLEALERYRAALPLRIRVH